MYKKILLIAITLAWCNSSFSQSPDHYDLDMTKTHEGVSAENANYVLKKIMLRKLNNGNQIYGNTIFGVHGMETPSVEFNGDLAKQDKAFELLSRAGVDSLRSSEAAWHRIADKNGNPSNLNNLKYQLNEAKKYHLSHLFVVGYPPAQFTVAHNKLSAVDSRFINRYIEYLNVLMGIFKGYSVDYLELGNEVDAPTVWWKHSTPEMYVNEMRLLQQAIQRSNENIKTVAFSATYSRREGLGGNNGGRNFLNTSFALGIDRFTDAYSLHHFDMNTYDSFPGYMHNLLSKNEIKKPLLDTEQLDTGYKSFAESEPYDLIKIYARGFFMYKMNMVDYFNAKDIYLGNRLYSIGLFDIYWRPKLRLLAYAMAVDSLKGRELIKIAEPKDRVEAYMLSNRKTNSKYKYTILLWSNDIDRKVSIDGFKGDNEVEQWNLDTNKNSDSHIVISNIPVAIYTNYLPKWAASKNNINRSSKLNMKNIMPN